MTLGTLTGLVGIAAAAGVVYTVTDSVFDVGDKPKKKKKRKASKKRKTTSRKKRK